MSEEWYKNWFDSPYYHWLYAHRDENEAEYFLSGLIEELKIKPGSTVLDLACGKGRHAIFLQKQGLKVTGVDLSENNIREALHHANDSLEFLTGDMRNSIPDRQFQYIFNLFTSFGYFDSDEDNLKVVQSVVKMLVPGGIFILDFFNASKLTGDLCAEETKRINGIIFHINRHYCDQFIVKEIHFKDQNKSYNFSEKVRLFDFGTLKEMLNATGLQIIHTFGSYALSPFDEKTSDRLIIVAQKN